MSDQTFDRCFKFLIFQSFVGQMSVTIWFFRDLTNIFFQFASVLPEDIEINSHNSVEVLSFLKRECLNVGTVPTCKMHNVGTVPMFKMHNIGTVPTFKMHKVGTQVFYDYFLFEVGL